MNMMLSVAAIDSLKFTYPMLVDVRVADGCQACSGALTGGLRHGTWTRCPFHSVGRTEKHEA